MLTYVLRKLLLAVPLLWGVITLIFLLVELSPGDATDRFFNPETPPEVRELIMQKWGLDQPAGVRYGLMLRNLVIGEFGVSISKERPVFDLVGEALPNTILLSLVTLLIVQVVGILLGTFQAVRQYSRADTAVTVLSLFFYSMPSFWLALMLQLVFALHLRVLPSSGMYDPVGIYGFTPAEALWDRALHLVLPGGALALASAAGIARYMRSSLLEVVRLDYVRTARAKGLPEVTVIFKHAMRNALLPIITILGIQLPYLFSGAVLVESIFSWPGMGRLILSAITEQDTPVIIACFFVFTLLVVLGNLIADLLYAVVDPRIRLS